MILKMVRELVIQIQKDNFENMKVQLDEINRKSVKLKESENFTEMKKFIALIERQKTMKNFTQYTFPTFHECKIDKKNILKLTLVTLKIREEANYLCQRGNPHHLPQFLKCRFPLLLILGSLTCTPWPLLMTRRYGWEERAIY